MVNSAPFIYYLGIAAVMFLSALGGAMGQGIAAGSMMSSMLRQEAARVQMQKALFIGLALIETAGIFALLVGFMCIKVPFALSLPVAIAGAGGLIGMGIVAGIVGLMSGFVVSHALEAVARQPFQSGKVLSFMVLSQVFLEAPVLFSFLLSIIIRHSLSVELTLSQAVLYAGGGLLLGGGSVGPVIGQGIFCKNACQALGRNIEAHGKLLQYSILTQIFIETPVIFCVIFSFLFLGKASVVTTSSFFLLTSSCIAMIIMFTLSSLGTAIGIARVGASMLDTLSHSIEMFGLLFKTSLPAQIFIETGLIYSLVLAFFILRVGM